MKINKPTKDRAYTQFELGEVAEGIYRLEYINDPALYHKLRAIVICDEEGDTKQYMLLDMGTNSLISFDINNDSYVWDANDEIFIKTDEALMLTVE